MFSRAYKTKGVEHLSTYLKVHKIGDIVDIKGNGAQQKGMPHKSYHGKTGRVFNVSRRALGVVVNKRIKNRILAKRINIRLEHLKHSTCREDFLKRAQENDNKKKEATAAGVKVANMKRLPAGPRSTGFLSTKGNELQDVKPIAFEFLF